MKRRRIGCRRLSAITIIAALSQLTMTGTATAATVWHQGLLRFIYPQGDGSFIIGFVTDAPGCSSANSPKYMYVSPGANGVSADGVKNMLATALAAFAMDKSVAIAFDDSTTYCYINRLSMER